MANTIKRHPKEIDQTNFYKGLNKIQNKHNKRRKLTNEGNVVILVLYFLNHKIISFPFESLLDEYKPKGKIIMPSCLIGT